MIAKHITLVDKVVAAEAELKALKAEKKDSEERIYTMLVVTGASKVNVSGATVSPMRTMRASAASAPLLIEVLKEEGLDALVSENINSQTLSGWVRRFDPDRMLSVEELIEKLPANVQPLIHLFEQQSLSIKRT